MHKKDWSHRCLARRSILLLFLGSAGISTTTTRDFPSWHEPPRGAQSLQLTSYWILLLCKGAVGMQSLLCVPLSPPLSPRTPWNRMQCSFATISSLNNIHNVFDFFLGHIRRCWFDFFLCVHGSVANPGCSAWAWLLDHSIQRGTPSISLSCSASSGANNKCVFCVCKALVHASKWREQHGNNMETTWKMNSSFALWAFSRLSIMTWQSQILPFSLGLKQSGFRVPDQAVTARISWDDRRTSKTKKNVASDVALDAAIILASPVIKLLGCLVARRLNILNGRLSQYLDDNSKGQFSRANTMSTAVTVPYLEKRAQIASSKRKTKSSEKENLLRIKNHTSNSNVLPKSNDVTWQLWMANSKVTLTSCKRVSTQCSPNRWNQNLVLRRRGRQFLPWRDTVITTHESQKAKQIVNQTHNVQSRVLCIAYRGQVPIFSQGSNQPTGRRGYEKTKKKQQGGVWGGWGATILTIFFNGRRVGKTNNSYLRPLLPGRWKEQRRQKPPKDSHQNK